MPWYCTDAFKESTCRVFRQSRGRERNAGLFIPPRTVFSFEAPSGAMPYHTWTDYVCRPPSQVIFSDGRLISFPPYSAVPPYNYTDGLTLPNWTPRERAPLWSRDGQQAGRIATFDSISSTSSLQSRVSESVLPFHTFWRTDNTPFSQGVPLGTSNFGHFDPNGEDFTVNYSFYGVMPSWLGRKYSGAVIEADSVSSEAIEIDRQMSSVAGGFPAVSGVTNGEFFSAHSQLYPWDGRSNPAGDIYEFFRFTNSIGHTISGTTDPYSFGESDVFYGITSSDPWPFPTYPAGAAYDVFELQNFTPGKPRAGSFYLNRLKGNMPCLVLFFRLGRVMKMVVLNCGSSTSPAVFSRTGSITITPSFFANPYGQSDPAYDLYVGAMLFGQFGTATLAGNAYRVQTPTAMHPIASGTTGVQGRTPAGIGNGLWAQVSIDSIEIL